MVLPSPIRVGSLCSGMKTEHWSLDLLRWDFEEVFWCEPDETARKFVEANMSSKVRGFRDLMGREFQENAPPCDLLVAGFPCQPFSIHCAFKGTCSTLVYIYIEREREVGR